MKHAPHSYQRHDLYTKYQAQDSEISGLLGKCGSRMRKRSKAAEGLSPRDLDYDHAVPMRIIIEMILNAWPSRKAVKRILKDLVHGFLITKAEHALLRYKKLSSKMPDDWNGKDWTARYKAAGIDLTSS